MSEWLKVSVLKTDVFLIPWVRIPLCPTKNTFHYDHFSNHFKRSSSQNILLFTCSCSLDCSQLLFHLFLGFNFLFPSTKPNTIHFYRSRRSFRSCLFISILYQFSNGFPSFLL